MQPKDYAQLLYEVLKDKPAKTQGKILGRFKKILTKSNESYLCHFVEKEFEKIQGQREHERITYISSASELTAHQKKELEGISTSPREFSVNPDLLGGVAVRNGDVIYNATLRKKLECMKSSL